MSGDIERAQALEVFGYTVRQAGFLALVAVHGGTSFDVSTLTSSAAATGARQSSF